MLRIFNLNSPVRLVRIPVNLMAVLHEPAPATRTVSSKVWSVTGAGPYLLYSTPIPDGVVSSLSTWHSSPFFWGDLARQTIGRRTALGSAPAADEPHLVARDTCIEGKIKRRTSDVDKWFWHAEVSMPIEEVGSSEAQRACMPHEINCHRRTRYMATLDSRYEG